MHILAGLGIDQVFTTAGFDPLGDRSAQQIKRPPRENSSNAGRIRQVGLVGVVPGRIAFVPGTAASAGVMEQRSFGVMDEDATMPHSSPGSPARVLGSMLSFFVSSTYSIILNTRAERRILKTAYKRSATRERLTRQSSPPTHRG